MNQSDGKVKWKYETDGEILPMMGVEGAPAARMLLYSVIPKSIPLVL